MSEARAWFEQAAADFQAGEKFLDLEDGTTFCHAVAKFQQAAEKSVKGLAKAFNESGVRVRQAGWTHSITRSVQTIRRIPQATKYNQKLRHLFDSTALVDLRALDELVPRADINFRNTEYPFLNAKTNWQIPTDKATFKETEVKGFRKTVERIVSGVPKIASAIVHRPRRAR